MAEIPNAERLLPQAAGMEAAVLGSMLLDPHAARAASYLLQPEDFYKGAHRTIFAASADMLAQNDHFDQQLLIEELLARGQLEEVGGIPYLVDLAASLGSSGHVESYCALVRRASRLRRAIAACTEVVREGFNPSADPDELLGGAIDRLLGIVSSGSSGMVHISEPAGRLHERLEQECCPPGELTGVHTIDRLTNGLHERDYLVIGARPSTGKTSLGLIVAMNMAQRGTPVAFFSLEMHRDELMQQALRLHCGVDSLRKIPRGEEKIRGMAGAVELAGLPITIVDSNSGRDLRLSDIMALTRALAADGRCRVAVVDYLGLVGAPEAENRQQQVTAVSKGFKMLARLSGARLIVLCQLNREPDKSGGGFGNNKKRRRPQLSDFRESGSIEQDCDIAVLLWRPNMARPREEGGDNGEFHVHVAKNRYGPIGEDAYWLGSDGRLLLAAEDEAQGDVPEPPPPPPPEDVPLEGTT